MICSGSPPRVFIASRIAAQNATTELEEAIAAKEAALADERIRELIEGKTVRKVVVVPGKLVNVVAN